MEKIGFRDVPRGGDIGSGSEIAPGPLRKIDEHSDPVIDFHRDQHMNSSRLMAEHGAEPVRT